MDSAVDPAVDPDVDPSRKFSELLGSGLNSGSVAASYWTVVRIPDLWPHPIGQWSESRICDRILLGSGPNPGSVTASDAG